MNGGMSDHGTTAYEEVKRSAWLLPVLALSAYPLVGVMFFSLPGETPSLDDQAAGMLMAAAAALILVGPIGAALSWLLTFTPGALRAQAARLAKEPGQAKAGLSQAKLLAEVFRARVIVLVSLTDAPVLGALLLSPVPGADVRTAVYAVLAGGLVLKGLAIGAVVRRAKPLLLEAGR